MTRQAPPNESTSLTFSVALDASRILGLGSPRPSTEPKTPKPQKVSKKVSREVSGTPRDPQKVPKKVREVQEIVKINYFLDFSDFFWNFFGGPGGSQRQIGRLFGDFLGFRGFGLCRWSGDPNPGEELTSEPADARVSTAVPYEIMTELFRKGPSPPAPSPEPKIKQRGP